jgi:hypothetical protein
MSMRRIADSEIFVLESGRPLERILELDRDYTAVAYQHDRSWHLLTYPEIAELRQEWSSGADPESLLGSRGEVVTVTLGMRPTRPAVVLDAAGEVSGAWLAEAAQERRQRQTSPPLRGRPPSRRRSVLGRAVGKLGDIGLVVLGGGGNKSPAEDAPEMAPPADGNGSSGDSSETVRRTPHLDAPDELEKAPGTEFPVFVFLDDKELRPGESGEGIELDLPPDVDAVDVGVLLQLTGHFELAAGSEFGTITVTHDDGESAKLEFKLRVAREQPSGPAAISALFTLRGRSCGHVARVWDWATEAARAPRLEVGAKAPVSMPLHVRADQASLSIFITAPVSDGIRYQCAVQAPALKGYEEPTKSEEFAVPAQGYVFMTTLLNALTDQKRTSDQRFRALREVGHKAWDAAPQIVRDVLWKMIDEGVPPKTINVASVEPLLPWELMIPRRNIGGRLESLGPLGVEFAIGRWTRGDGQGPPPSLKVSRSFVIAPTYAGNRQLNFQAELELIEKDLCGQRIQPATIADLDRRFDEDHAALLHFVCHGAVGIENDDAIELEAKDTLRAGEMETLEGFERLCQATHPLVFLNSCSTGQMVPSLAGGAGFPRSFGTLGANAIIAPLWPVDDVLASKIAVELYEKALVSDAEPIAEILRDIRHRGYQAKDADTFAAYCFFGDPQARLELLDCTG